MPTMRPQQKLSVRAQYRAEEHQRVTESISLAEKFRGLKSLTVDLMHFDTDGVKKTGEMKYRVNLEHAKSVFRFNCPNHECIRGDFDLSEELAKAVAGRRKIVTGELACQGWQDKTTVDSLRCGNILRYKLSLAY
jgi:hypothetical protein